MKIVRGVIRGATVVAIVLGVIEILSASALFYFSELSRAGSMKITYRDEGRAASVVLGRRVARSIALRLGTAGGAGCRAMSSPAALYQPDDLYGYAVGPGTHELTACPIDPWVAQSYQWTATIDPDGGRRTSYHASDASRRIVLLGDSWMFGWALNDEQSMAWLLQAYVDGQYRVKNFAQTGGGSAQELIAVRQMADTLGPDDIVVLGYADYYLPRNVAAPRRVAAEAAYTSKYKGANLLRLPRASLRDGHVIVDFLPLDCALLSGYCQKPDPGPDEMQGVTVAVYQEIRSRLRSHVAVLYLEGSDDDPMARWFERQAGVTVIDARLEHSAFFERDDIPGYDAHPGALANDAYFRRVRAYVDAIARPSPR